MAKKELLGRLWCKRVILLKPGARTCGQEQEEQPWGLGERPIIYSQVGRVRLGILSVPKEFWKQGFQDPDGASYCWEKVIYYCLINPWS